MGYAKYTEDDNEMRMERYRTFDYLPYYSEYYSPLKMLRISTSTRRIN